MTLLTNRERTILMDLARQVMPRTGKLPAVDAGCTERFEEMLKQAPMGLRMGLRVSLNAFGAGSILCATKKSKERYLQSWLQGGMLRRNLLRAVLIPLKISSFSHPLPYRALGCSYGFDVPKSETRRRWRDKVITPGQIDTKEIEADVVVVGTGAGGAVAAKELAEAGLAVAMVEEGDYFTRKDFDGRPARMQRKLYRGLGMTVTAGNAIVYLPMGKTVGGSTTVNSGTCMRTPRKKQEEWKRDLGLEDLGPGMLDDYLEQVESFIGVAPASRDLLGGNARVIARGAGILGLQHGPLRRNAPECEGAGLCPFGCPTGAKQSMDITYVPAALRSNAFLYTGLKAQRIIIEGGRATGVVATTPGKKKIKFFAKAVVAAAGSLFTPVLLKRSGLKNRWIARNLSIHPSGQVTALMPGRVDGFAGIPQGYQVTDPALDSVRFEGVSTPLELLAGMLDLDGRNLMRFLDGYRNISTFGFMIDDTARGIVLTEADGWPFIFYNLNRRDLLNVKSAIARLARIYLAAGAGEVYLPVRGHRLIRNQSQVKEFESCNLKPGDLELGAFHPLGTCRAGGSPRISAINPEMETWEVANLYVTDGSAVPTSLGANPQVTIMAMAAKAAKRIAARLVH
ncbi:MAG: GMC family oxidoreductase [Deltaproteobacteria bacterium]|nr:GMC family oxidoreductase [Deltaproteobacteria bacterium]